MVQHALGDVHSTFSGQPRPFSLTEQLATQPFHSASLPLDAQVPDKIWKEEFVDFGVLLSNPDPTARYELKVWPSPAGHPASVVLEPTAKSKQKRNISDWLCAFHIFFSIYMQRYSHDHCQIVQYLAARDRNWPYYDENFPFLRQTQAFLSRSLWRPFIGNCGCACRIIRVEQAMCLHRKVQHAHLRLRLLHRAFAINFTVEPTAQDVNLSTFVLSVTVHIVL